MGIIINHDKDPYEPNSISWKVRPGFFRGSVGVSPLDQKRMQTLGLATVKTHDPFGPCSGAWTDQNGMYYHVALAGDVPWYPWDWGDAKMDHGNFWRVWTLIFRGNEVWVRDLAKFHCEEFTFFCLRKNLLLAAKAANALVVTKNQPGRPPRQYRN